jgi:hypothetical protein
MNNIPATLPRFCPMLEPFVSNTYEPDISQKELLMDMISIGNLVIIPSHGVVKSRT